MRSLSNSDSHKSNNIVLVARVSSSAAMTSLDPHAWARGTWSSSLDCQCVFGEFPPRSVDVALVPFSGSMDPYSRAPRSPKVRLPTPRSTGGLDVSSSSGLVIDDCKSPSVEQVRIIIP